MTTRFEKDTAVTRIADNRFAATIDEAWWVYRGPHGGYVGAIVMRAMCDAVDDPVRAPRSFSIYFLQPPEVGAVEIETTIERAGRAMTSVSARLVQGRNTAALAMAAFSAPRSAPAYADLRMPEVPRPADVAPVSMDGAPPHISFYDLRHVMGPAPFSGGREAVTGGWIRFSEPQVVDAAAVVSYADAWMPALFSRVRDRIGVPTVDLSVHFRVPVPDGALSPDEFVLVVFRSPVARDGFLVEDGEIWSEGGELIAQSRQLAAMLPVG